jgi:hypothetical protein
MPIDGGRVVFQIESPRSLFLERCDLNWCGGTVLTHAVRFDPADAQFDVVLFADNIDLVRVLSLMKGFDGSGSGALYGKLPLSIRKGSIQYRDGFLYSVPGQTGELRISKAGLLTAGIPKTAENYESLKLAEDALRDFRFSLFRLDLTSTAEDDTQLRFRLEGRSAKPDMQRPVKLDVNVKGALQQYIDLGLRIGGYRRPE